MSHPDDAGPTPTRTRPETPLPSRPFAPRRAGLSLSRLLLPAVAATLLALAVPATIGIEPATATAEGSTTAVIAGEVVGSDGSPAVGVGVYLSNSQGSAGYATTDNGGSYRLDGLAADSYTLLFWCREVCVGNYVEEYWENAPSASSATPLVLADGEQVRLKTELTTAGAVSGTVRGADGTVLKGIGAILTQRDTGVSWSKFVATDAAGNYQFRNVPPAGYTVEFRPAVGTGEHLGEYWNDATTLSGSDVLLVAAGETTTGVDSVLAPAAWITDSSTGGRARQPAWRGP